MKKVILITVIAIVLLILSLGTPNFANVVHAETGGSLSFSSGVTLFSPLNKTYNGENLVLNLSLHLAGNFAAVDPNISMNYSIDETYKGSIPLKSNGKMDMFTTAIGMVNLPKLTQASHCLTIYLYGLNQGTYEPKYLSYVNTVYFSTFGINPTLSPTSTPSPSPTLSPSPSPLPTLEPAIVPTSTPKQSGFLGTNLPAEYGYAIIAFAVIVVVALAAVAPRKKKNLEGATSNFSGKPNNLGFTTSALLF
jgi:hypothetical protein